MTNRYCVLCESEGGYRSKKLDLYLYSECPQCHEYYIEKAARDRFKDTVLGVKQKFSKMAKSADESRILVMTATNEKAQEGVAKPRVNGVIKSKFDIEKYGIQ